VAAVEAAPTPTAKKTQKAAARRPRWGLVGVLVIALVAVGWWIGMRLTSGMKQQDTTTAMVPVPPPASPMSSNTSPPAVMPAAPAADAGAPAAAPVADAVPPSAPAGTTVAGAAPAPAAGAPATPATGPLTPIENVPVNPPVTTPVDPALATAEAEDWSLAQAENTREGYEAYLRRYRRGPHARDARNAIAELNRLSPPTVPAAPDGTAAAPGMGRVVLNIRPWGQVFVDGADRGVSPPLKSLPLRPGIYNIEVRNGDLEVYRQRVTVQDSKSAPVVSHEFK